jgi:hypothetical protein
MAPYTIPQIASINYYYHYQIEFKFFVSSGLLDIYFTSELTNYYEVGEMDMKNTINNVTHKTEWVGVTIIIELACQHNNLPRQRMNV